MGARRKWEVFTTAEGNLSWFFHGEDGSTSQIILEPGEEPSPSWEGHPQGEGVRLVVSEDAGGQEIAILLPPEAARALIAELEVFASESIEKTSE